MILSNAEFQTLVSAFQFMFDSFDPDPQTDLTFDLAEDFLAKLDHQAFYRPSPGEVHNCILALQMFCASNPSSSSAHLALLQRFLALQFRNF